MKHLITLLITFIISAASVYAGDVKVKAVMATSPGGEPTTSFTANTPTIHALFKTKGGEER